MTIKQNRMRPFPTRPPATGSGVPMRIVIDIDPVKGTSMRAEGPVTPLLLLDTLVQQLQAFWNTAWRQMGNGIVSPNGMPVPSMKPVNAEECKGFEATDDNPEICRYCGNHYGNHPGEGGTDANGSSPAQEENHNDN